MKELSLHILDVAENSITAGADLIEIHLKEDYKKNVLEIVIADNGRGMDGKMLKRVTDPFFTTKGSKKVGLGLSLLKETCEKCDGDFLLDSSPAKGTRMKAWLMLNHIDLPPLGNMAVTIVALILRSSHADILYTHQVDDNSFSLDTREIKKQLEGLPINNPQVIGFIKEQVEKGLTAIGAGKYLDKWRLNHAKADNTGA